MDDADIINDLVAALSRLSVFFQSRFPEGSFSITIPKKTYLQIALCLDAQLARYKDTHYWKSMESKISFNCGAATIDVVSKEPLKPWILKNKAEELQKLDDALDRLYEECKRGEPFERQDQILRLIKEAEAPAKFFKNLETLKGATEGE